MEEFSDGGSTPPASTKTDTANDTIVSLAVSLFYRRKRCDSKAFCVIALHFVLLDRSIVCSRSSIERIMHNILWFLSLNNRISLYSR